MKTGATMAALFIMLASSAASAQTVGHNATSTSVADQLTARNANDYAKSDNSTNNGRRSEPITTGIGPGAGAPSNMVAPVASDRHSSQLR